MTPRDGTADRQQRYARIYRVVAAIPPSRVASYGKVAALAGLPRGARQVGRSLAVCPASLPWHRVLSSAGRIALPEGDATRERQRRRLAREGVAVIEGRVNLRRFGWQPDADELLWGPAAFATPMER
jgi:methylated-DNA-protein-cysteine methyltransferase-like protein